MTPPVRDAVLPVDKPEGPTSHDVVATARRALGTRKVGHTGTLDPLASGLLLLCVGRATRLSEYLSGLDKTYVAEARLGARTDTGDREGAVVAEDEGWRGLMPRQVEDALARFQGELEQVPPQFSAKKVGGVPMHRRARKGQSVELAPRPVTVHEISATEVELPLVRFRVRCSSGTYIRALARDLGDALGVGAHLTALRRTDVGRFGVDGAPTPEKLLDEERVGRAWIDPLEALGHLPRMDVSAQDAEALRHGRFLPAPGTERFGELVVAHGGRLVAIATVKGDELRPRKVFAHE